MRWEKPRAPPVPGRRGRAHGGNALVRARKSTGRSSRGRSTSAPSFSNRCQTRNHGRIPTRKTKSAPADLADSKSLRIDTQCCSIRAKLVRTSHMSRDTITGFLPGSFLTKRDLAISRYGVSRAPTSNASFASSYTRAFGRRRESVLGQTQLHVGKELSVQELFCTLSAVFSQPLPCILAKPPSCSASTQHSAQGRSLLSC